MPTNVPEATPWLATNPRALPVSPNLNQEPKVLKPKPNQQPKP